VYDAWGNERERVGTSANKFTFTGHELDEETAWPLAKNDPPVLVKKDPDEERDRGQERERRAKRWKGYRGRVDEFSPGAL
jgi:hypothetical protein